ncbi:MAG TPA: hypothetical protein VNH15_08320 [Elusimicrobiota bacterium]|nr:hypothetical protein [Elusimicrobiota bacterium]
MDKKPFQKACAALLSLAVLLPSLLSPANLRAQAEEAAPQASFGSPAMAGAAAGLIPSIQALPSDFSSALSVNPAELSVPVEGSALGAAALEDQASVAAPGVKAAAAPASTALPEQNATASQAVLPISAVLAAPETAGSVAARQSRALAPPLKAAVQSPARKGLLGRVARLASRGLSLGTSLFDGSAPKSSPSLSPSALSYGILRRRSKTSLTLPPGVRVTKKVMPLSGQGGPVSLNKFYLSPEQTLEDGSQPVVLNADPSDMASVERALRGLVDQNPSEYGAASSQDMMATSVQRLPGAGNQADSIIAVFRQVKEGTDIGGSPYSLAVEGANLRFHIKVLNGKAVVMAVEGGFVPGIDTSVMTVNFTDQQMEQTAAQQVGASSDGSAPAVEFLTRQLTFINGSWRAMNVYQGNDLSGNPVIVLVDVNSGQAFAVNPDDMRYGGFPGSRLNVAADAAAAVSGQAQARGTTLTQDGEDHGPTGPMPLINTYVYDDAGRVLAVTDTNGTFTLPADLNGGQPVRVTVKLDGIYGKLFDEDSQDAPIVAVMMATPGRPVTLTLNPSGDNEQLDADVNGYVYPYKMIEWLKSMLGLGGDARFFQPLRNGIHANGTQMVANAFYDPTVDAFFLMKRGTLQEPSSRAKPNLAFRALARIFRTPRRGRAATITLVAENTAQPSIELHEFGHRQYQVASQIRLSAEEAAAAANRFIKWLIDPIIGSESNEAGADTFSMFIRNSPVIGNGFFLSATPASALPSPNIIRTGENQTAYDTSDAPNDDPHRQGETQMGTAWQTYQDLIPEMGQAAALEYAAKLFIRTWLYVQPGNVASALTHALLADMAQDGTIPHADIIRGHAQNDHGLTLPSPGAPPAS